MGSKQTDNDAEVLMQCFYLITVTQDVFHNIPAQLIVSINRYILDSLAVQKRRESAS